MILGPFQYKDDILPVKGFPLYREDSLIAVLK